MNKILYIENPEKLKITRLSPCKVNFKYNGKSYELRGEHVEEAGSWQTLYIRNENGTKQAIGRTDLVGSMIERIYFPYRNSLHKEYKFLDTKDFVWKMTKFGVVDSPYKSEIDRLKMEINAYLNKINQLLDMMRYLDTNSTDRYRLEIERANLEFDKNRLLKIYRGRGREDGVLAVKRTVGYLA